MYRREKKIPTILGIFFLFAGIGAAVLFDKSSQSLISQAGKTIQPENVHFSNINESSFTVSWVTSSPIIGSTIVTNSDQKQYFFDDLDSDNIPKTRLTHFITVKNLKEDLSYSVKIISGNQNCSNNLYCPTFTQTTAIKLPSTSTIPPVHGTIITGNNQPAEGAIVYISVNKSALLSSRVDSSGLWVIPLNNLRSQDFLTRPVISDNDIVQISVELSPTQNISAVIDVKSIRQNLTIPKMTMGNTYNFIDLLSKKDLLANNNTLSYEQSILGTSTQNNVQTENTSSVIDVLFPKNDGDSTPDNRPKLRGIAPAGKQLLITVNSSPQSGKITVNDDGTWTWRPPKELPPGTHDLSIQVYDENGNLITVNRKFIVLKSGESVLGESTPSASLTPTTPPITSTITASIAPSPSIIISPTPQATITNSPTAIPTSPPRSGSTQVTVILIGSGLVLFLIGAKLAYPS